MRGFFGSAVELEIRGNTYRKTSKHISYLDFKSCKLQILVSFRHKILMDPFSTRPVLGPRWRCGQGGRDQRACQVPEGLHERLGGVVNSLTCFPTKNIFCIVEARATLPQFQWSGSTHNVRLDPVDTL
jgi:hypothetical protein